MSNILHIGEIANGPLNDLSFVPYVDILWSTMSVLHSVKPWILKIAGFSMALLLVTPKIGYIVDRTWMLSFPVDFVIATYDFTLTLPSFFSQ